MSKLNRLYIVTYWDEQSRKNRRLSVNVKLTDDDEYLNKGMELLKEILNILDNLFNTTTKMYSFHTVEPILPDMEDKCFQNNAEALKHIVYYDMSLERWVSKRFQEPNMNILNILKDDQQNVILFGSDTREYIHPTNRSKLDVIANQVYMKNFIMKTNILTASNIDELLVIIGCGNSNIQNTVIISNDIILKDLLNIYNEVNYRYNVDICILDKIRSCLHTVDMYSDDFTVIQH